MKATLKELKSEYPHLFTNSPEEVKELKIAFKKLSQECSKAGISTLPLTKLLSTIYANVGISKGFAAILKSKLNQSPIVMNRDHLTALSDLILEEIWETESTLTSLSECLDIGKGPS